MGGNNKYIYKWVSSTYTSLAYMGYYNIYHKYGLLTHINGYDIWGNITYRYKWVSSTYTCLAYMGNVKTGSHYIQSCVYNVEFVWLIWGSRTYIINMG